MKILVLGGGVIGVTTAYYLIQAGHDVTLLDRHHGVALETSYANAGEISPGYAAPWAAPGLPKKVLKWMLHAHSPLVVHPRLDGAMWRWLIAAYRNCNTRCYTVNKTRMLRLANYSRDCLQALREETEISYAQRSQGTLQLFRTEQQVAAAAADIAVLQAHGVPYTVLSRAAVIQHEPALGLVEDKFVGGLHLPDDETGDCFLFTKALAEKAKTLGAEFHFATQIQSLQSSGQQITQVVTDKGQFTADAYVLALGSYTPALLRPLGLKLPIYPVKGYSLTLPITDPATAPESTIMDESFKVAITRLGDRIRVGGTAELSGFNLELVASRLATLKHSLTDLFPKGGDLQAIIPWAGLRPMTPDGPPIIGATAYPNLFLNTGHGTLGWTMAAGSGKFLADLISDNPPDIDPEGFSIERYA